MYGICVWVCMEFVAAGRFTVKQLKPDQTIRNLICGDLKIRCDSTESNRVEKDWVGVRPRLVWGKGVERWCDLVCKVPLDDWVNRGSDDLSFTYGEYGFSFTGI